MVSSEPPSRQIVYSVKGQIHYDNTVKKISETDMAILYDSVKDVILFDLKDSTNPKNILAHIQISPNNRVNMYVKDNLQTNEFDYIEKLLRELLVSVSNSEVELEPIKTVEKKYKFYSEWFNDVIWRMSTPIRIVPKKYQIITSTLKKWKKSENST